MDGLLIRLQLPYITETKQNNNKKQMILHSVQQPLYKPTEHLKGYISINFCARK